MVVSISIGAMSRHHHAAPSVNLPTVGAGTIRTSELLGALSTALHLTEGLLPGHAARTCWIAMRMAERIGPLSSSSRAISSAHVAPRRPRRS